MEDDKDSTTSRMGGDSAESARSDLKQYPINLKRSVEENSKDSNTSDRQCPICFESISDKAELFEARCCNVLYHKSCWSRWNVESELCPTCRAFHRNPDMFNCRECGIRRKCGDYGFGRCNAAWYCEECWDHWWSIMRHLCLEHDDRGVYFRIIAGPRDRPDFAPDNRDWYAGFHRRGVTRSWDGRTRGWSQGSRQPIHLRFLPRNDRDDRRESPDRQEDLHAFIHIRQDNSSTTWQRSSALPQPPGVANARERASSRDNSPYPQSAVRADGPTSSASLPRTASAELQQLPSAPSRRNNFLRRRHGSGSTSERQSFAPRLTRRWNCNCPYHRGDVVRVTHAPLPAGERQHSRTASHNLRRAARTSHPRRAARTSNLGSAVRRSDVHAPLANGASLFLNAQWHSGFGGMSGTPSMLVYPLPFEAPEALQMRIRSVVPQLFAPQLELQ
eukprot:GEMP01019763.1.p1 GENE.GEMP01019763.1~~GEMP01019763.1.p1  ORF type:complete len:446 (+),score=79.64 GEMP01019763.1:504-1841(+)